MASYWDLLKEFIITDFKLRYKHSFLGFLWVVIKPLAMFLILHTVWSSLLHTDQGFAIYLLLGIISMNFFSEGVNFGMQSLFSKAHIILKVNFPREVVVFSSLMIAVINMFVNMLVFAAIAAFGKTDITFASIPLFLISLFSVYLITLGISFFLSVLAIRMHDLRHLIELVLQLIFWATPVIYKIDALPVRFRNIILLNPLSHILASIRLSIINGSSIRIDSFTNIGIIFLLSCLFAALGYFYFKSRISRVAEYF